MSESDDILFPCAAIPPDAAAARLLGLYPQRQDGRWMQRVKVPGGTLSAAQWQAVADAARRHTPATPLHLTTRQDLEFHDLSAPSVPAIQQDLAAADLSGVGACGDTVRNVTVCPCSGAVDGVVDLHPLAQQIRGMLAADPGIFRLPRKFKISLSACEEASGQPWINDLGFIACRRGERWGFQVVAGGSLGPAPGTGVLLHEWLDARDVLPLVAAAVRFFARHGDRANRARARLRHVRRRLGDAAFVRTLNEELARVRADRSWPQPELAEARTGMAARIQLAFPNGDLRPEAADALAEAVRGGIALVRISNHHRVILIGRDEAELRRAADRGPLSAAARPAPRVVACPGTRWCAHALTDTCGLGDQLRRQLDGRLPSWATVCISGCPNGCAQSRVAHVGIVGRLTSVDGGAKAEAYDLFLNGGMGAGPKLADLAASRLSARQVVERLAATLPNALREPSS